jgi:zinc protease
MTCALWSVRRLSFTASMLCLIVALPASALLAADISPTKFVTPNGMTVLVLEQHFLPIVEVHALIKSGSAQDPPEKAGLANLVASLLDEGTTTRSSKQLAEQIDFVGGALEVKATEDFTTASVRVLKKDAELGFTLLADIVQHPAFLKPEFERIRSQILGEMASDNDDPGHVAMKAFNQLVFHGHPYRWPLNGTEESLGRITHADVANFYAREYTPSQTILTIVGDVTAEQVTALAQTHFGSWKKVAAPARTVKNAAPLDKKTVQPSRNRTLFWVMAGSAGPIRIFTPSRS